MILRNAYSGTEWIYRLFLSFKQLSYRYELHSLDEIKNDVFLWCISVLFQSMAPKPFFILFTEKKCVVFHYILYFINKLKVNMKPY